MYIEIRSRVLSMDRPTKHLFYRHRGRATAKQLPQNRKKIVHKLHAPPVPPASAFLDVLGIFAGVDLGFAMVTSGVFSTVGVSRKFTATWAGSCVTAGRSSSTSPATCVFSYESESMRAVNEESVENAFTRLWAPFS
jgi:hypothetical protein